MQSVFMLAAANLRRHKGAALSLGLMVLIASLLLNLGFLNLTGLPRIFDTKLSQLHPPYACSILSDAAGKAEQEKMEQFIADYKGVTETETEKVLFFPSASFKLNNGGTYSNTVIVQNMNETGNMSKLTFVGEKAAAGDDAIYAPYILHAKGYRLGDKLTITCNSTDYTFKIAGFTEDMLLGSLQTGGIRFYMPGNAYTRFMSMVDADIQSVMISARTASPDRASDLYDTINEHLPMQAKASLLTGSYSIDISRLAVSTPISIGAAMEIAFALIVALVLLLVIRFRIANSIEEEMQNIGALQAVGHTSRQVRLSLTLQFLIPAFIFTLIGISLSYAVAIPYGQMLTAETGMSWSQTLDMPVNLLTLILTLLCVTGVAFFSTRRIRRLPVIVALRGGISTHSFRRNPLPLEHTHGPVNLLISLKSVFSNARHNVALCMILAAVSFASVFVFLLFYNFSVDNSAVMHVLAGEPDDIIIGAKSSQDAQKLISELPGLPHITSATDHGYASLKADGLSGYGRITSDFGKMKNDLTYEGRFPKHDNEVAIGGKLAEQLHKNLGDSVSISLGNKSYDYIITGFTQCVSDIGKGIYLTSGGINRISPDYRSAVVYVYVDDKGNINGAIHSINAKYGDQIITISNEWDTTRSAIGSYTDVVGAFAMTVFGVMGLIVILILTLITGAMLVRHKRDLGIEKALGFTTLQLMQQLSLSTLPAALFGSLIGGILSWFGSSGLISLLFKGMGIMKIEFILPPASVPVVCVIVALLTYVFSMLSAVKVRKISPCALISE